MADLTADAPLRFWNQDVETERIVLDNSAAQTVYKGVPLMKDISADTSYARVFTTGVTIDTTGSAAAGNLDVFFGIAAEGATVATTDTEIDNEVEMYVEPTIIGFQSTVFTTADVAGQHVYMSDSGTLATTGIQIGDLHRVEDGYVYVRLRSPTELTTTTG